MRGREFFDAEFAKESGSHLQPFHEFLALDAQPLLMWEIPQIQVTQNIVKVQSKVAEFANYRGGETVSLRKNRLYFRYA